MSYVNWRKRLRGEPVKTILQPQLEDEGFYRRPITEKVIGANGKTNGQSRIVGWEPVALYIAHGKMCGRLGNRELPEHDVNGEDLWSRVCRHPITEAVYRAVAERGEPWPDASPAAAFNKDVAVDNNVHAVKDFRVEIAKEAAAREAAAVERGIGDNKPPAIEPHIEHGEAIENAIRAAKDLEVTDDASAAVALGAQNRIAELRLSATKVGKSIYAPIYQQYKTIMGQWTPMIEKAENWEKVLDKRYKTWRAEELRKAAEAKRAAEAEARRIEEEIERAAQRAIAAGNPEPPPDVPAAAPELPPAPAPVSATYRAAGQRTVAKDVERWHLDAVDDYDAVYAAFKAHPDVRAALLKIATTAVKQGQEVPGTRRHFGLI
jgi:hypothetical protein